VKREHATLAKQRRPPREPLLRALLSLFASAHAADREDAIMDAILRVLEWEEAESTDMADAAARAYASRMVENLLLDKFRREARSPIDSRAPFNAAQTATPDDTEFVTSHDVEARAEAILEDVEQPDRELLYAYFAGSEFFRDEVHRQCLRAGTARVRIHRLLKRLKTLTEHALSDH